MVHVVGMVEPEEEGPFISQRKIATKQFALSMCTAWDRLPLLEYSLPLLSAAQLSGKAMKILASPL